MIRQALEDVGVPAEDAGIVEEVLLAADRRGIEAYGSSRLDVYLERLRNRRIVAKPARRIINESSTTLVIDAGGGLGHPAAAFAMNAAIRKAETSGAAFAAVRDSSDLGFTGYYAMLALPHDMIGMAATNTARYALPTFGRETLLGANPFAFAIPTEEEPPFVLDLATTTVAPAKAAHAGALLPLGGAGTESGGHKGYGLGLLVEVLCTMLSAGIAGFELPLGTEDPLPRGLSHFFGAFRIDGFREPSAFKRDMDALIRDHRASEKAPGHARIYLAGEPEWEHTKLPHS